MSAPRDPTLSDSDDPIERMRASLKRYRKTEKFKEVNREYWRRYRLKKREAKFSDTLVELNKVKKFKTPEQRAHDRDKASAYYYRKKAEREARQAAILATMDELPKPVLNPEVAARVAEHQEDAKRFCDYVTKTRQTGARVKLEDVAWFKFLSVHLAHKAGRECARCIGAHRLETPIGRRRDVETLEEWNDSPYNCQRVPDVPNGIFWPES
jgi:hypothetical protein